MKNFLKAKTMTLFFIFFSGICYGQNAYNDALTLKRHVNRDTDLKRNDTVRSILDNYIMPDRENNIEGIDSVLDSDNPFLGLAGKTEGASGQLKNFATALMPGANSALVIADGIGKFLAKRTKEELNVLFFDRFREFLNTHPEMAVLFPSTSILLNAVLNQGYTNLLSTLHAAFDSDLKAMLGNLALIGDLQDSACDKCIERKKQECKNRLATIRAFFNNDRGRALMAGLLIADGVVSKKNPADILSAIVANNTLRTINSDVYQSFALLAIFSGSLRSADPSGTWISKEEVNALKADAVALKIYLGLVYQQVKNAGITFGGNPVAETYLQPPNTERLKNYIGQVIDAATTLESSFTALQEADNGATTTNQMRLMQASRFVGAVQTFFKSATQYTSIHPAIPVPTVATKQVFLYVDSSLSIVQKILAREYYGAVLAGTVLLENLLQTRADFNSNGELRYDSKPQQETALRKKLFLRSFLRYGNFAANVVAADNSDEVAKAIEAIALPPGSASIKRTTNFNIALQAYTGFVGGHIKGEEGTFNSISVYAPVGVAFSIGLRKGFLPRFVGRQNPENKNTWGSLSLFASIIDVGAFVSYRFYRPDEKFSDSVNIAWSNIFAPGINLVYGVPKWPLSLGFGVQHQATLRRIDANSADVVERSGLRYNFFLALDLPVLNIFTSKR